MNLAELTAWEALGLDEALCVLAENPAVRFGLAEGARRNWVAKYRARVPASLEAMFSSDYLRGVAWALLMTPRSRRRMEN